MQAVHWPQCDEVAGVSGNAKSTNNSPRKNIDPASRDLEGAYLADLDDLAAVANANQRAREAEAARARSALAERAARAFAATQTPPA
jgi:glutamyl-tRNA reductase